MLAQKVDGTCPDCGSSETYYSSQQDATIYKVYGSCEGCGTDHGCIGRITDADNPDQAESKAEQKAQSFFG